MLWGPCNSTLGPEIQSSGWDGWFANSIFCYFSLWNIQRHKGSCYLPGQRIHFPSTASPRATRTECVSACKRELTFVCNSICICRRCSLLSSRSLTNKCVWSLLDILRGLCIIYCAAPGQYNQKAPGMFSLRYKRPFWVTHGLVWSHLAFIKQHSSRAQRDISTNTGGSNCLQILLCLDTR